jgi:hypothetical protein
MADRIELIYIREIHGGMVGYDDEHGHSFGECAKANFPTEPKVGQEWAMKLSLNRIVALALLKDVD